jgi:hypothetical protein
MEMETRVRDEVTKQMSLPPRSKVEYEMVSTACDILQRSFTGIYLPNRTLFPEQATIRYPDFNPDKIRQIIAVVNIPAIVSGRRMVLSHPICDGDCICGTILRRKQ